MQMRAQDYVDVLRRHTRRPQSLKPRPAAAMKVRARTLFVVAAACVDQNSETGVPDQKTLDGDDQDSARRILKARYEPGAAPIEMCLRAVAENLGRRQERTLVFDD